jgi:hypothetical protein
MQIRKSWVWLTLTGAGLCAFLALVIVHPALVSTEHGIQLEEKRKLVRDLLLTDMCLFTDASFTRNPSQADLHAPFQDHPTSFDYFPSGSIVPPSVLLRINYDEMADDAD